MVTNSFKKVRFKPLYKQILGLRINALHNLKVLKFKKKKWQEFIYHLKTQLKTTKYKKYKIFDQNKILINKKNKFEIMYKTRYFKKLFVFSKIFNVFFGKLARNYYKNLKKNVKTLLKKQKVKDIKLFITQILESRLDNVLYRSKFCSSIRSARQYIAHGHIFVNKKPIKNKSFLLKSGDLINLNVLLFKKYKLNLVYASPWPLSPINLIINYKTMEILFLGNFLKEKSVFYYPFYFRLHKTLF